MADQVNGRKDVLYSPITIETVDAAVHDWLDLVVDSHVTSPTGERKKVAVTFGSGERAVTAKERKGIRDAQGILILPIISLRRTAIARDAKMSALGAQTPNIQISKLISPKSNLVQNLSQGSDFITARSVGFQVPKDAAVYEVTTIPFPDRSILTYELQIQAQYITQMNQILEKIFREFDLQSSFLAPIDWVKKHSLNGIPFEDRPPVQAPYVVGFFQTDVSDSGNFEEFTDQERIVRYTTNITVPANLNLDPEGEKPALHVEYTVYTVQFQDELVTQVDDPRILDEIFSDKRKIGDH